MALKSRVVYQDDTATTTWVLPSIKTTVKSAAKGYQTTYSYNTDFLKFIAKARSGKKVLRHWNYGGFFHTYKSFGEHPRRWSGTAKTGDYNVSGHLVAENLPGGSTPVNSGFTISDRNEMIQKGVTAIARVEPLNPLASSATLLGELRKDGLPKLPGMEVLQNRTNLAKGFGSDYLNTQFALKPLISDLNKIVKSVRDSEKIITQVHRDSGRLIRRRYVFPLETSTTVSVVKGDLAVPKPTLPTAWYKSTSGTTKTTTVTTEKQFSFSGAFTYYLPKGEDNASKIREHALIAHKLYGAEISPEVLYNLTPWSWALDWVSNMGDNIHNFTAFAQYGLVMPYGYVMLHKKQTTTVEITGIDMRNINASKLVTRYGFESKTRYPASPFGFGLNLGGFSPEQWAIVGALGLTKAPGKLPYNAAPL